MKNVYILTGASSGIGSAIAHELLSEDNAIYCISRHQDDELVEFARKKGVELKYFECDIADSKKLELVMEKIFNEFDKEIDSITLINNAGVLRPIMPAGRSKLVDIEYNLDVNLKAPILLASMFINRVQNWDTKKRIFNISSSAGKKPYFGWSSYCASKAGIDLFTRTVGVEQANEGYPIIISFAPGGVDTPMQKVIRSTPKEDFLLLDKFIGYKDNNQLFDPKYVAKKLLDIENLVELENGGIYDIESL